MMMMKIKKYSIRKMEKVEFQDEISQLTATQTNVNKVKKKDEESDSEGSPDSEQILDDFFNGKLR